MGDNVPAVHGLGRIVLETYDLWPDSQRANKDLIILQTGLQVHQHLARIIISVRQILLVVDPANAAPATAIKRLHIEGITDLSGDIG